MPIAIVFHHKGFERPTTIGSVGQIIHAGVDLGIARAAFADTLDFVRTQSRPWKDSGVERAADDPLTIARIGEIAIKIEAATALIEHAGRKVDIAQMDTTEANVIDGHPLGCRRKSTDHRSRPRRLHRPVRTGRHIRHPHRPQSRPPLA